MGPIPSLVLVCPSDMAWHSSPVLQWSSFHIQDTVPNAWRWGSCPGAFSAGRLFWGVCKWRSTDDGRLKIIQLDNSIQLVHTLAVGKLKSSLLTSKGHQRWGTKSGCHWVNGKLQYISTLMISITLQPSDRCCLRRNRSLWCSGHWGSFEKQILSIFRMTYLMR